MNKMSISGFFNIKRMTLKKIFSKDRELGSIFTLHRVAPFENGRLFPNESMKISPEFLENKIKELKEKKYTFLSLDELHGLLVNKKYSGNKFAIFTLDDGYYDNYIYAYPVFKKHDIPFAIYVVSNFPDKKAVLWWYILEDLILANEILHTSDGEKYNICSKNEKEIAFMQLREKILQLPYDNFNGSFIDLFSGYSLDLYKKVEDLSLSWSQIVEMSDSGLCTIGSHSVSHPVFKKLSRENIFWEVKESKRRIEQYINKPVEHFAYPYGSNNEVDEISFEILKELSFKTAVVVGGNEIMSKNKLKLSALPRVTISELKNENNYY